MSDAEVIVQNQISVVEVEDGDDIVIEREIISIVSEGVQGPPGASGAGFVHTQGSAATEWIVNHNLGFRPSVEIIDVGGREVDAEVLHISANQLRVYFNLAMAGSARCV